MHTKFTQNIKLEIPTPQDNNYPNINKTEAKIKTSDPILSTVCIDFLASNHGLLVSCYHTSVAPKTNNFTPSCHKWYFGICKQACHADQMGSLGGRKMSHMQELCRAIVSFLLVYSYFLEDFLFSFFLFPYFCYFRKSVIFTILLLSVIFSQ